MTTAASQGLSLSALVHSSAELHQSYEGETIMMAPASGFYSEEGYGKNEVRIAYAIDKADLKRAIFLLGKALEQYPGRVM